MGWYERLARWFERHRFLVDLTGTVAVGLMVLTALVNAVGGPEAEELAWSLAVLAPFPWARVRPVASTAAVFAVTLAFLLVSDATTVFPTALAVPASLYTLTVYGPRWAVRTGALASVAGCVLYGRFATRDSVYDNDWYIVAIVCLFVFASAYAFGLVRRSRRAMLVAMDERAVRLAFERDQQAQIATAAERARIAREMHDIVAHSLSVVVAQADGGRYAAASDPEAAARALGTIAETGRAALTDMRRLLGVLREDPSPRTPAAGILAPGLAPTAATRTSGPAGPSSGGPADDGPPLAPQPDVTEIGALVDQVRAGGAQISLARLGTERRLPPGVGLTLYRVCQEALTNVLKHAGPEPRVTVLLRWADDEVELRVDDDGRGLAADTTAAPSGYGLQGMQERATLFGGTLQAGPRAGGGFRVRFTVPLPPPPSSPATPADPADPTRGAVTP